MAFEFTRNLRDAATTVTRALTASDGSVTSSDIDMGGTNPYTHLTENIELDVYIPELAAAELASADTLVVLLQHGAAASPTTSLGISKTITGTGSTIAAQNLRFKLPPDTLRYVNVKFTTAGTSGDMSDKTAIVSLRY